MNDSPMVPIDELAQRIAEAEQRIRPYTALTPLTRLSVEGKTVFLKLENEQHTGSFKARGSLNKVLTMDKSERLRGIITASTGNHGLGVARALQLSGTEGTIYLPQGAKPAKVEKLRLLGTQLEFVEGGPLEAEIAAKSAAHASNKTWISPYNDIEVITGQGTIAVELLDQHPGPQRIFLTVGGGGLISGVAGFIKATRPNVEIIGCVPTNSPEMMLSVNAGHIVHLDHELPTLSDGSAGGAEDGSITFEYCRTCVDRWISVSESSIADAMRTLYRLAEITVEGSAGVAFAAWHQDTDPTDGDIVVICGGNIEETDFLKAIA